MTKYRIKKCETSKRIWYEVEYTKWWYFGWWRVVLQYDDGWSYSPMVFKTEEEARYEIKTRTKKKEPVIVSYIREV